jgi:hypothetical protein
MAVQRDPRNLNQLPSTKGVLWFEIVDRRQTTVHSSLTWTSKFT